MLEHQRETFRVQKSSTESERERERERERDVGTSEREIVSIETIHREGGRRQEQDRGVKRGEGGEGRSTLCPAG